MGLGCSSAAVKNALQRGYHRAGAAADIQTGKRKIKKRPLGAATPNGRVENIPSMTKGVVYFFMLS